ncbi:hypothetical protein [Cohnella massiliensis]|uniref:hypothetical protein n=1 Tax=Cohnella massiliensis TaxID=1816691 RepID=UPI0009B98A91|nr:hypothetical protein [Cohnella massiliensis]
MEKIVFEKREIRDQVTGQDGKVVQEGTPITAELLNRYEETLAQLVATHNSIVDNMHKAEELVKKIEQAFN